MEYLSLSGKKLKKSRSGSIPKNVDTMKQQEHAGNVPADLQLGTSKTSSQVFRSFVSAMLEKLAEGSVTDIAALEAAKHLSLPPSTKKHVQMAALGGAASPAISVASRAAKGFADTGGGLKRRLHGAVKSVGAGTTGDYLSSAVSGGLTGGALSAARNQLQTAEAKKTVNQYLKQHAGKS